MRRTDSTITGNGAPENGKAARPAPEPALRDVRDKWDRRWQDAAGQAVRPDPPSLALRWRHRFAGGPLLDAACGLGRGIAAGQGHFRPVYAVDLSEVAVRQARALWAAEAPGVRWVVADVNALRWPEGAFGLICAFGFTDWRFLERVPRLLRPGGLLLYEGFAARQRELKPELSEAWIGRPEAFRRLFGAERLLECSESAEPPYRLAVAARG